MNDRFGTVATILCVMAVLFGTPVRASAAPRLETFLDRLDAIRVENQSADEYDDAAAAYRALRADVQALDRQSLAFDDQVDFELLEAQVSIRLFEIEELRLHEIVPVRYLALGATDRLFVRPCGQPDRAIRAARDELRRLPRVLDNARVNLKRPARTWTENAIYTASYAETMLRDMLGDVCVEDPNLKISLVAAGAAALDAVRDFVRFLESELLPRSDRSPAWKPAEIERYQFVHEQLRDHGVDEMIRIAAADEQATWDAMTALAKRIHPSGDLRTVWEVMKEEAPPWPEVRPMAERYVALADGWLRGEGAHLVTIPERFDYGVEISSPMARRILSFGGASYGPTIAGRISGYYVLTPLEPQLDDAARKSRIKAYNPYWTHVISYHEWLGHNVQRAIAEAHADRPMRRRFRSIYLSQAWSFYLEKLLEDEGYFEATLPYMEALKTRMARLQMRMWRIQRILTKLRMAKGETTFEQAVAAYVEKIGMEPTNALIEVQRDSQSPSPPGREIIGERLILELRDRYAERMGQHFQPAHFHEALLRWGELPLPVIERLIFPER